MQLIKKVIVPFVGLLGVAYLVAYDIQLERDVAKSVMPVQYGKYYGGEE